MIYTAFAALRKNSISGLYGGFYVSVDFDPSGAEPTWTAKNTGLAHLDIYTFRTDPFDPVTRQYCQLRGGDNEIYRRDTSVSDGWTKIMDLPQAIALCGDAAGGVGNERVSWIAPDTNVPGRLYTLYNDPFTDGPLPLTYTYLLRSNDYGDTWAIASVLLKPVQYYPAPWRGGEVVEAHAPYIYVAMNDGLVATGVMWSSMDNGSSWARSQGSLGTTVFYPSASIDREFHPEYCYGSKFAINNSDLVRVTGVTWEVLQDALGLFANHRDPSISNPDSLWISPNTALHHRFIKSQRIYNTTDAWVTYNNPGQMSASGLQTTLGCLVSPSNDPDVLLFGPTDGGGAMVWALDTETGLTPIRRAGANWDTPPYTDALPSQSDGLAYHGLWIGAQENKGVYVYASAYDGDPLAPPSGKQWGIPELGDRSAYDITNYPKAHASDVLEPDYGHHPRLHAADHEGGGSDALPSLQVTKPGVFLVSDDGVRVRQKWVVTDPKAGVVIDEKTGYVVFVEPGD